MKSEPPLEYQGNVQPFLSPEDSELLGRGARDADEIRVLEAQVANVWEAFADVAASAAAFIGVRAKHEVVDYELILAVE